VGGSCPIAFDEHFELGQALLLGAHRRLVPRRLLERPLQRPLALRGLGLLQAFGLLPQALLETRGSRLGRTELLLLPEDGFLGVEKLGV
jgi:hypothetical protein